MNIKEKAKLKEKIKESHGIDVEVLDRDSVFDFKCKSCGMCCTNSTVKSIVLRAHDIFNLSVALNTSTARIIELYGNMYLGSSSGLPVVQLKSKKIDFPMNLRLSTNGNETISICPFLKNNRCAVHSHKPSPCRLYPLGRVVHIDKSECSMENKNETVYFLQKNTLCGNKGETHSIDEWLNLDKDTECIFNKDSELLSYIGSTINLANLIKIIRTDSNYNYLKEPLSDFYEKFNIYYYIVYDKEKPFNEQFELNSGIIKKEVDVLASSIKSLLSSNLADEKVIGDIFKVN